MTVLFTAHATATSGRAGHTETDNKKISLDLSPPGGNGAGSNPEELFACGYGACFGGAVEAVAKQQGAKLSGPVVVKADVALNKDDAKGFYISVVLNATLPGVETVEAQKIVQEAHEKVCPYSKATRGNVDVTLQVDGQELKQAA